MKKSFIITLILCVFIFIGCKSSANGNNNLVTFVSNGFTLNATIDFPKNMGNTKKPAVVFVHGSGPNDRDGTYKEAGLVYKPYKDLAHELAKRGYIVFRYDKRTFTMKKMRLKKKDYLKLVPEDFITDARKAIDYVRTLPQVDANSVYLVAHSQGGTFAPFISKGKNLKGVILLAPGLLPLKEQLVYQLEYQIKFLKKKNVLGNLDAVIQKTQMIYDKIKIALKKYDEGSIPPNGFLIGMSLKFFSKYNTLSTGVPEKIITIEPPVLLVNGSVDLKCPVELIKAKFNVFKQKIDLKILYIDNMTHALNPMGLMSLDDTIADKLVNWMKSV